MSTPDPTAHGEFGAEHWEQHYRSGGPVGAGHPGPGLVAETSALVPGRALDAGCGRGAGALWLASRGWDVTAVDVSSTALARAQETASTAGPDVADRIQWVHADLTTWHPGGQRFDLVASQYVHVPGPAEDLFGRLASWVAPEGTLLVVGHDSGQGSGPAGHAQGHGHTHPLGAQIRTEQVTAGLPEDEWEVVVAESRTHVVPRPDGAVTLQDAVVRARRIGRSR